MREVDGLREALRQALSLCEREDAPGVFPDRGAIKALLAPHLGADGAAEGAAMAGPAEVAALADATWQILDDMGIDGQCACLAAKAKARVAYEPFRQEDDDGIMPLEQAKGILAGLERRG